MKRKMTIKEGRETNPRFSMMEGGITLREIEKWYGKETANSLVQYCDKMGLEIDDVAGDDRAWDKFEMWAKARKRGLGTSAKKFDNWKDASRIDDKDSGVRARQIYDTPADSDIYGESGDQDENDVLDFITDELNECEWVKWVDFDDYDATCTIGTSSGKVYDISVKENTTVQIDD